MLNSYYCYSYSSSYYYYIIITAAVGFDYIKAISNFGSVKGCLLLFKPEIKQRSKSCSHLLNSKLVGWSAASLQHSIRPHFYLSVLSFINIYVVTIVALILTFDL